MDMRRIRYSPKGKFIDILGFYLPAQAGGYSRLMDGRFSNSALICASPEGATRAGRNYSRPINQGIAKKNLYYFSFRRCILIGCRTTNGSWENWCRI